MIWFRFLRLVCCFIAYGIRYDACDCAGRNWASAAVRGGVAITASALEAPACESDLLPVLLLLAAIAVLLSYLFFPGETVRTPAGAFSLASWHQIALLCHSFDVPSLRFYRESCSRSIAASVQASSGKSHEQHRNQTVVQHSRGGDRSASCKFPACCPASAFSGASYLCAAAYALLAALLATRAKCLVDSAANRI